ncbi:MAG: glycosyltransferase [Vicinamibacterales bacterium]
MPRIRPPSNARDMFVSVRSHVRDVRRRFPFDAIIGAFAYPDAVVASRLAQELDCPFLAIVMGSDINDLAQRPPLKEQICDALRSARAVVALSGALKNRLVELGIPEDRVVVLRNSVNGRDFIIQDRVAARRKLGIDPEGQLACFIGNLVHEKGPDILLEALAGLSARSKSLKVVFVGDGVMTPALQQKTKELGLSHRVTFPGRCLPDRVPLWIAASDVVCLPSRREGCPNVVLEALACGRPVVACDVGGVPELLSARNGIMSAPEDSMAFGLALEKTLQGTWSETDLRQSAPSLAWDDFGRSMNAILLKAMERKN